MVNPEIIVFSVRKIVLLIRNTRIVEVETLSIHQTLLDVCSNKDGDESRKVHRLLLSYHDLVAAEARYHQNCYTHFARNYALSPKSVGRPIDSTKERNFDSLCDWFESECELYTLHELWRKLAEITSSDDVYDAKTIKFKLPQGKIFSREDIFTEDVFANRGSLSCEFCGRYFREIRIEGQFREKYFRDFLRYDKQTTIISKSPHNQ